MERTSPFSTGSSGYPEKALINNCINGTSSEISGTEFTGTFLYTPCRRFVIIFCRLAMAGFCSRGKGAVPEF
jgi:hypothetical protein